MGITPGDAGDVEVAGAGVGLVAAAVPGPGGILMHFLEVLVVHLLAHVLLVVHGIPGWGPGVPLEAVVPVAAVGVPPAAVGSPAVGVPVAAVGVPVTVGVPVAVVGVLLGEDLAVVGSLRVLQALGPPVFGLLLADEGLQAPGVGDLKVHLLAQGLLRREGVPRDGQDGQGVAASDGYHLAGGHGVGARRADEDVHVGGWDVVGHVAVVEDGDVGVDGDR